MAFREVTMVEVKEILRLSLAGVPKKRIAQLLGFDMNTVRRYLAAARARGVEPAHDLAALDDELVAAVVAATQPGTAARRRLGHVRGAPRLHRGPPRPPRAADKGGKLLRRRGVEISYDTLRRSALEHLGFGRTAPTAAVADCGPGEEVQLDTGWMTLLEKDLFGRCRRFRAWIFTAVLSRHRFVYPIAPGDHGHRHRGVRGGLGVLRGVFKSVIGQHQGHRREGRRRARRAGGRRAPGAG